MALTLVDLGRTDDALAAVAAMGPGAGRESLGVLKEMIRRRQAGADSPEEEAEDPVLAGLLARYREVVATLRDPADRVREQRWLAATRARRLLAAGAFARAIDLLSREVMQLRSAAGGEAEPELTLLLADAHRGLGDFQLAGRLYRQAQRTLPAADPLAGDALLGLAALAEAQAAEARAGAPQEEEAAAGCRTAGAGRRPVRAGHCRLPRRPPRPGRPAGRGPRRHLPRPAGGDAGGLADGGRGALCRDRARGSPPRRRRPEPFGRHRPGA